VFLHVWASGNEGKGKSDRADMYIICVYMYILTFMPVPRQGKKSIVVLHVWGSGNEGRGESD